MYQGSEIPQCGTKCIAPEKCLHNGCVLDAKERKQQEAEDEVWWEMDGS